MRTLRRWRNLAMGLAYANVAWNLLLFAVNPAWGSLLLAGIWLIAALAWSGSLVLSKRREQAAARRHVFLTRPQPRLPDPFRPPVFVLQPGERVVSIPQVGGQRMPQVPRRGCSHWPRDEVKLADGTTAAYICRRCGHDWANEDYVRSGVEW